MNHCFLVGMIAIILSNKKLEAEGMEMKVLKILKILKIHDEEWYKK